MAGASIAEIEPDAAAPGRKHFRQDAAGLVDNAVRWRREHMGDDVAGLEEIHESRQRRDRLPHVDHHGQVERGSDVLRTSQHLVIVGAGDIP